MNGIQIIVFISYQKFSKPTRTSKLAKIKIISQFQIYWPLQIYSTVPYTALPLALVLKQECLALAPLSFPSRRGCNRSFNPVSKDCSRFQNLIPPQLWLIDQKLMRELKGLPFESTLDTTKRHRTLCDENRFKIPVTKTSFTVWN